MDKPETHATGGSSLHEPLSSVSKDSIGTESRAEHADDHRPMLQAGRMMSTICHDLRSSLSSIVMGADLLQRSLTKLEGLAAEKRVVGGLVRSAERLTSLVSDLDDLAHLESGTLRVDKRPVELAWLMKESVEAYARAGRKRGVTVLAEDAPAVRLDCDPTRILQALAELVDNAVRHSPENGNVLLEASVVSSRAMLSVSDMGPGMGEDTLRHAFDASWHASQSPRHGTGLGLTLVRGIAKAHGGDASIERGRPEGLRVSFWIPVP